MDIVRDSFTLMTRERYTFYRGMRVKLVQQKLMKEHLKMNKRIK
jgi:hypothetical protein